MQLPKRRFVDPPTKLWRRMPLALLTLFTSQLASADPTLSPFLLSAASVCIAEQGNPNGCGGDVNIGVEGPNGGLVQLANTYTSNHAPATITVDEAADASFGVLKSAASASFEISGDPLFANADSGAEFGDILTINFPPWNGSPGLLQVNYTLDGQISSAGNGQGSLLVALATGANFDQVTGQIYTTSTAGLFSFPDLIHFVYGQPFGLAFALDTVAGTSKLMEVGPGQFGDVGVAAGQGSASAQFFNTFVLSGLIPMDANGNPAMGATFSSASGTQYSIDGVIPEPRLLPIVGSAFAVVVTLRSRKRRVS